MFKHRGDHRSSQGDTYIIGMTKGGTDIQSLLHLWLYLGRKYADNEDPSCVVIITCNRFPLSSASAS